MAKFDEILTPATNMVSRIMSAQLRRQAPVDTGALKRSIHVKAIRTNNSVQFVTDYLPYGVYTDMGTGPYKTTKRGEWNPKPGKGKGGIKPRFWTSPSKTVVKDIRKIMAKAMGQYIKITLTRPETE